MKRDLKIALIVLPLFFGAIGAMKGIDQLTCDQACQDQRRLAEIREGARQEQIRRESDFLFYGQQSVRQRLRDGDAAKFQRVSHRGEVICGQVNGTNAFGGYAGWQRFVSAGKPELTWIEEDAPDFEAVWSRYCV